MFPLSHQMAKTGRPTKLNDELTAAIVARVTRGHDPDTSAQAEGIDRATYHRWMRQGRADIESEVESVHETFARAIARACAEAEVKLVDTWLGGDEQGKGFGPAKASAEFLRLTKRRYGERVRIQVEDELQELLSIVERVCSAADFARVLEAIAARDSGQEIGIATREEQPPVH